MAKLYLFCEIDSLGADPGTGLTHEKKMDPDQTLKIKKIVWIQPLMIKMDLNQLLQKKNGSGLDPQDKKYLDSTLDEKKWI